jgi:hypothetical protein
MMESHLHERCRCKQRFSSIFSLLIFHALSPFVKARSHHARVPRVYEIGGGRIRRPPGRPPALTNATYVAFVCKGSLRILPTISLSVILKPR